MRISLRVYRLLLRLYPARFREEYGSPLQRQFKDDYAEVTGPGSLTRLWLHTLADLARSLPGQLAREAVQDGRHTFRLWRRRPLHTAFAIGVMAIAIGANTGIFSVLNALLLRSLPFSQPERLATMRGLLPGGLGTGKGFHEWRGRSTYASDAFVYTSSEVNLDGAQAVRARLTETSWNFFDVIGRGPGLGRGFAAGEDLPGAPGVAVINHALSEQMYGSSHAALGSVIRVNGVPLTVVGIAPPGFDYPLGTTVWAPTAFDYQRIPRTTVSFWFAVARLKDDVSWPQARLAFETEAYAESPQLRNADAANRPALRPLREELAGPVRQASLVLMAGAGLLLLLACANVANFLLAHTVARQQELAIRAALGASRARLTQQLLTETVLLSITAAAAGLAVAWWTTSAALAFQPVRLASQAYSILDWQVLMFSMLLSVGTGLLFGAGPVAYVSRRLLPGSARTVTAGRPHMRLRNTLVLVQVAVTVVLVGASAALGRRFVQLLRIDNGYELQSVATMSVSFAGTTYSGSESLIYYQQAVQRLTDLPHVVSVSATQFLPLAIDGYGAGRFTVDEAGTLTLASTVPVAPGYFTTFGGHVVAGREFTAADLGGTEPIAIVNEEFARVFGGSSAMVGRRLTSPRFEARQIVGVVRGMRDSGPLYEPSPQIFLPSRTPRALTFVVKVAGAARDRIAPIRDALSSVDPRVPVFDVKTMDQRLEATLARPKFYATAVTCFAVLALLLSIIGVYGVVASAVRERLRELGIRLALGTTPTRLRGVLLGKISGLVAAGAVAGAIGAVAASRYLGALIPGADTAVRGSSLPAIAGTLAVAAAATWMATRRVARLDIMETLRPE